MKDGQDSTCWLVGVCAPRETISVEEGSTRREGPERGQLVVVPPVTLRLRHVPARKFTSFVPKIGTGKGRNPFPTVTRSRSLCPRPSSLPLPWCTRHPY